MTYTTIGRSLFRILLVVGAFLVSTRVTSYIVHAAVPDNHPPFTTFANDYNFQLVNHTAMTSNNSNYFYNVIYGVANWDTVTTHPSFTLTNNTDPSAAGNIHFWERDYTNYFVNIYLQKPWSTVTGQAQLFIPNGSNFANLIPCSKPDDFWYWDSRCNYTRPVYAHIRMNTNVLSLGGMPTQNQRGTIARHELGHVLGLGHSGCTPQEAGVMVEYVTCAWAYVLVSQLEANLVMALYP